jgi:hypothetical protein
LTKELVESRKTQKKKNEEFAQLKQKDNSGITTISLQIFSDEFETNNAKQSNHLRYQNGLGQATRKRQRVPQCKKKENSPTDVPVLGGDYDTGPEEDDYMITVDT